MTSKNPRAGWEKIGEQFYRKIQLYESVFDHDLELENYLIAGAPYGGALGMSRSCISYLSDMFQHCGETKARSRSIEGWPRQSPASTYTRAQAN